MEWLRDVPGFGALVDGLTWAISRFDNKDLAFAIAFAILVLALGIWAFLYLRRHRPWLRPIRRLSAELRRLRGYNLDASEHLARADGVFESEPAIASLWREYRKNLKPNPQSRRLPEPDRSAPLVLGRVAAGARLRTVVRHLGRGLFDRRPALHLHRPVRGTAQGG